MENRLEKLEKSVSVIVKDINKLGAKIDKVYIDIATKEIKIQKDLDSNTLLLKDVISDNRDELKALIINRLIWIIGAILTGVMAIVQHFESLHAVSIKNISTDIAKISVTVDNNKILSRTIDVNLKNLTKKVDEYNNLHILKMEKYNNGTYK